MWLVVHGGGDCGRCLWLVLHSGGDCGRFCGECRWWCMVVVIVGSGAVNVVGGA